MLLATHSKQQICSLHLHLFSLTFLATNSELLTASAFGSNSPKNNVKAVSTAVINPKDADGKYSVAVATNKAVLGRKR